MLAYEIINVRSGGQYSVIGCDVVLGYRDGKTNSFIGQLTVKGVWLRERKEGAGYFVSWPSAVRAKDGVVVKENGKPKYDNLIQLYGEEGGNPKKPGEWAFTPAAWEFQEAVAEELLQLSKATAKTEAGRGPAKASGPARGASRPAVRTATRPARAAAPAAEQEADDDLPF